MLPEGTDLQTGAGDKIVYATDLELAEKEAGNLAFMNLARLPKAICYCCFKDL